MAKIYDMKQERADITAKMRAIMDKYDNTEMSGEDKTAYAKMEADFDNLTARIDAEQKQLDRERMMGELPAAPKLTGSGRASDDYKTAFWNAVRGRPAISNALQEGTDSEGGYLVPDEFERTLIESLESANIMRGIANVIKTSSGDRLIPVVSTKGAAAWLAEEAAYTESDSAFGQITLKAHKLGTIIKASEELLNDSVFNLEAYISREFSRRMGAAEEEAFISGNGSGKPTGFLGDATTGLTAASPTAIAADELMDLYFALKAPYRKNAVFMMKETTLKLLRKLKDSNGQYIWQPSLHVGEDDTLLGKRVLTSEFMPTAAASAKSIAFGDFGYYWIADRQGIGFKRLNELYAANGQVGFLAAKRVDGKLTLSEAVQVLAQHA